MACLIQRHNQVFYIVSSRKGKRIWRSLYTQDRAEATSLFEQVERTGKRRGMTLLSFWEFTRPIIEAEWSTGTVKIYEHAVRRFSQLIGNKRLSAYMVLDFERYKVRRVSTLEKLTVNKELRTLRALFQRGVTYGYLDDNTARKLHLFKIDRRTPVFLSPDDFLKLLGVITESDFREVVLFALNTALRAGEIVHLEWKDVNLSLRQIHICNKPNHRVKTGKERFVPMNDIAAKILNRREQIGENVFAVNGKSLSVKSISDKFRRYRRKAEFPEGIRFHTLRHTSLTWMHHNGVPEESLRQIAGHSSIQTTQIYTHAMPHHLLEAANALVRCQDLPSNLSSG